MPGTIAAAPFLGFNALAASSNRSRPGRCAKAKAPCSMAVAARARSCGGPAPSGFYRSLNASATNKVDLEQIQKLRPQIAKLLREHAAKQRR